MSRSDGLHRIYSFGEFTLNSANALLLKNGDEIKLRPQSFEVLRILLERHGKLVGKDDLHAEVWGQKVVTDDSLAQCVIDIRRALGDSDRKIVKTIPRRGYTLITDVIVELVDSSSLPQTDRTRRNTWPLLIAAALVVVLAVFLIKEADQKTRQPVTDSIAVESIAVLPFVNMSDDPANEYFSDGLSETLLHMLAQVRELEVAARTSSFAFKGKDTTIREIGATLGVAHILKGSVRRAGDRMRITAQLVRAQDGFHVWSESYDRELTDIFAVQDEIAATVGIKLLASLLNPADVMRNRAPDTSNFEAYDLYLRARAEARNGAFDAFRRAETYLLAALDKDPGFLDAKADLAELMMSQADTGMRTYAEGIALQEELAGEVLADDPEHPKALALLLTTRVMVAANAGDLSVWETAETELRQLAAGEPYDVEAQIRLGFLVSRFGDRMEAVAIFNDVLKSDPLNTLVYDFLSQAYSMMGDYEAARDALLRAAEIDPDAPNVWNALGRLAKRLGDGVLAIDSYLNAQASDILDPELPGSTAAFLYQLGLPDEAYDAHQRVLKMAPDSEVARNLELLRAVSLGEMNRAVHLARDIIDDGPSERSIAWGNAARVLLFTSAERGKQKEDIAFIDKHVPNFSNLRMIEVPWETNIMRIHAFDVLVATKSVAELHAFSENITSYYGQLKIGEDGFPHAYLDWQILFGNEEAAMQMALDRVFAEPVTARRMWRLQSARPFMREFMRDSRMQEALQRWEQEEERIRSEVREYLAMRN